MITWREIIIFVIILVMVIVLGGCVSTAIFWSLEDSGEEFSKSHSGSCLVKQIWAPERVTRSAIEPARNGPLELDQGRDTRDLAFHMGRLLEYMFLDGQPKPVMMPGQHGDVPVQQDSRSQQDSFARQASSTLAFCSRLSVAILVLLLLHSTPLTAIAHRLKTLKYTNFFESEKDKILNAKVFKFLSSPFRSLDMVTCAVTDRHSKDRKKHDWLEDPLRWTGQFTEYTTFSVLERVASYRPFAFDLTPSGPSALALAEAGFLYPGVGAAVQCQGCRSVVDIESFNSPPTAARYHRERCSFVAASSYVRSHTGAYNTEDIDTDSAEGKEATAIAATTTSDRVPSRCSDTSNASPRTLKAAMAKEQSNNQRNEDPDITEILENSPACPETTANHVSYRPFAFDLTPSGPSALALAEAGFLYPGVGAAVQCQGCRSVVDIESFNSPPTAARYHRERCSFVAASSYVRSHTGAYNTEDIDTDSAEGKEATAIAATTTSDRVPSRCSDTSNASPRTLKAAMAKEQSNNQRNEDPDITEILENSPACPETTANHVSAAVSSIENQYDLAEPEEQHSEQAATAAGTMNTNFTAPWECKQIIQDPTSSQQQIIESVTRESEQRHQVPAGIQQQQNQAVTRESEQRHQVPAGIQQQQNQAVTRESEQRHQVPAGIQQQQNQAVTRESEQRHQVPAGIQQQQNQAVTRASEQRHQVPADTHLQATPASATMGACANPESSEQADSVLGAAIRDLLFDPNVFEAEAQPMPSGGPDPRETCQKNPGHYGSFPMWQLQLDHIPSNVRCPEMLELVQLLGKLVVKLTIKTTSRDRPHYDERTETQVRCGTGMAFVKDDSEDLATMEPSKKWNTIRRYLPGFKKNKGFIYIQTNYHLIFDAFEAENTMVEFFYDNPNSKEIVRAKGVSVTHSSTVGDLTSYLKCKISDLSMVDFVKNTENEVKALVARFPERIKGNLTKRVFVISHPHGMEKAFSYGEHALVKYTLKMEKIGQESKPLIAKVNNHTQISTNSGHIRKVLFYTADTCKGSSGGVVVSFKKTTLNGTEDIELDLWMHSCVEKKHGLNASVMKELTPDDVSNHGHTTINRPSIQDEQEAEADAAAGQRVTGPVYTVIGPPAHPVYVPYMKRLGSYPTPFNHVHTAADLADAGFFFAGYADCVRCFQCGLGLRSWKAGDIIYEEHNRNRPDCPFLQVKMRANGIHMLGFQSGNRRNNSRNSGQDQTAPQCGGGGHQNQQHNMPMAMDGNSENSPGEGNETQVLKPHNGSVANAQREPANVLTCSNDQEGIVSRTGDRTFADSSDVLKSTAVVVLEREQKYLKQIFTCKVCYQKPVKDLFLPCGELIACLDCSKLLTHCPSCNKKILATVTTYFS